MEKEKIKCEGCNWKGWQKDKLTAQNPFDDDAIIVGCPQCKSVEAIVCVCDEEGCWSETTCGTVTMNGYRRTCGKHRPENRKK